jgi:mono/diheme cytochrome c family protein
MRRRLRDVAVNAQCTTHNAQVQGASRSRRSDRGFLQCAFCIVHCLRPSAAALVLVAAALVAGCDIGLPAGRTPHREGNRLDMIDQPKLKPQRNDIFQARPTGLMEPQPGTVAVAETPYPYAQNEADKAGAELINPLQPTPEVLEHGKFVYEHVCITCHGPKGAGDGHVTALFPKPPSLMTQKVRDWPDGQLFHRPMRGQNSMPSHARQVDATDIWSVIHRIRAMQKVDPAVAPASTPPGSAGAMAGQAPAAAPADAKKGGE